jgi:hypothetical protein
MFNIWNWLFSAIIWAFLIMLAIVCFNAGKLITVGFVLFAMFIVAVLGVMQSNGTNHHDC